MPYWTILLTSLLAAMPAVADTRAAEEIFPLRPGIPAQKNLPDGGLHVYQVELEAGRSWHLEITGEANAPQVSVVDPRGDERLRARALFGFGGTSGWTWTSEISGIHRLSVGETRRGVPVGAYRLVLEPLALPKAADADRVRLAHQLLSDGAQLYSRAVSAGGETRMQTLRRAAAALEEALDHCTELDRQRDRLQVLLYLAEVAHELGDPARSTEILAEALPLSTESDPARAWILDRLGFLHLRLGDFERARRSLAQAERLWRQQRQPRGEVWTRGTLCLLELRQGRWSEAQRCYEETLERLPEDERRLAAQLRTSLGGVYANLGEPDLAIEAYRRALVASQTIEDAASEAQIRNNLGALHRRLGEAEAAIAQYQQALAYFRRDGDTYWQARTLNNLGYAYFSLGDLDRAQVFLRDALVLRREAGDRPGEAATLRNLGRVEAQRGLHAEAATAYGRALEIARQIGDRRGEATALSLLGSALRAQGDLDAAREPLGRALALRRDLGNRPDLAAVLLEHAALRLEQGEIEAAATGFEQALALFRAIRDPAGEIESRYGLAHIARRRARPDEAREHLEAALHTVETLRTRITEPTRRASFLAARRGAYELLIEVLMDLHRTDPAAGHDRAALEVSERARARTLLDLLERPAIDLDRDIPAGLRDGLRAAHRRLEAQLDRQVKTLARGEAAADSEVHQALADLETWRSRVRRASPRFAALSDPSTLSAAQIRALLDHQTALVEIALGDERTFLWWVTRDAIESFELPGRSPLESAARRTHEGLTRLDLRTRRTSREAARELARRLLTPIADRLTGPSEIRRLVIVADGALHYVPFATLPLPEGGETEPSLIDRFEIVHLPSASTLALQRRLGDSRPTAPNAIAVLADPVFDPRDIRLPSPASTLDPPARQRPSTAGPRRLRDASPAAITRLPQTREEALAIAALAPADRSLILLGFEASRDRVLDDQLAAYRMVHFATHGWVHPQNPELSGLMLSRLDAAGRPQNGFLSLHDLLGLDLAADLVVLSGCQTALGREVRGEGLVGLARGFLYAGVPRVVASLWQVQDRTTAELMAHFYRALLSEDQSPAAALREAQLAVRRDRRWRDPFFWGAFLYQGDWR